MRKLFSFITVLILGTVMMMAQNKTITGRVISAEDGEPVIGASVIVTGSTTGTTTDIDGKFSLNVPANAKTLTTSFVGMTTKTVSIKNGMVVELSSNVELIDEVIVTGYGAQRKASFTGAASILGGNNVNKKADANFVKSLEGSVTGFTMSNSTSMPGSWSSVNIRGMGSLSSSSQPLYVIDGMPVNSDYDAMSSLNNYLDPMTSVNPADIENVTVLKDAAATAIYGSRASNGVIVITTKRGGESKLNINLDAKWGVSAVSNNTMDFADAATSIDFFTKGMVRAYPTNPNYNTYEKSYEYLKNRFKWDGTSSYDWLDLITRKGLYQDYNLSINGSNGSTNYFLSGEYMTTEGIVLGSDMERISTRFNIETKHNHFSAGLNSSISFTNKNSFSQSTGGSFSNPQVSAMSTWLPFYAPYKEDGSYNDIATYNPLALRDKTNGDLDEVNALTININPYVKIDFVKGIWFKSSFGMNLMDQREYTYWSSEYNNQGKDYNGLGQQYNSRTTTLTWTNTLGWNYTFNKKHNVDLLLGQEMQKVNYFYEYYEAADFPFASSGMTDMSTAGTTDMGSEYYKKERTLASYFADAHYDYAHKYFASASFRRDGSSVFGTDNRWGNFWSYGLKWRMSEESWLKDNSVLTNAAIRFSQGVVGNQDLTSWYAARGYYQSGYNYGSMPGMVPVQISNPALTWEESNKIDLGVDLSFIDRIHLTIDYYTETTKDALFSVPLSYTTGMNSTYQNLGKVRNTGFEFGVNANLYRNKNVNVNFTGTLSVNKNKVIKMNGEPIESSYTIIEEGRPYRQFYMKEFAGVDPENGDALYYKNAEGDETTNNWNEATKRYVGHADPRVFGGFGINATFYGFDFNLGFTYKIGGKVYDSGMNYTGWGMAWRTPHMEYVKNSWSEENPNGKYPVYKYGSSQATSASTRFLMSGNYLRLNNLALGYTVPKKYTRKAMLEKVRLYVNFDNVYTWTASDFYGFNPDTYASGQIAWQHPGVFTFTGGVQLTF